MAQHQRGGAAVKLALGIAAVLVLNIAGSILIKFMTFLWPDRLGLLAALGGVAVLIAALRVLAWLVLGRLFQLSYIYPFLSLNYVFSVFVGYWIFDEPLQVQRVVGGVVIGASVAILSLSRHRHEQNLPAPEGDAT